MARVGLLVLALCLATAALASAGAHRHQHKHRRLRLLPAAPDASLSARARDDRHRHAHISARLATSEATSPESSAFAMPLTSGAYTGTGQYFVRLRVGTPVQPFVFVADTGSDLTWVKCRGAPPAGSPPSPRVFRPADSRSWAPIPCSSDTCTSYVPFNLANCSAATTRPTVGPVGALGWLAMCRCARPDR